MTYETERPFRSRIRRIEPFPYQRTPGRTARYLESAAIYRRTRARAPLAGTSGQCRRNQRHPLERKIQTGHRRQVCRLRRAHEIRKGARTFGRRRSSDQRSCIHGWFSITFAIQPRLQDPVRKITDPISRDAFTATTSRRLIVDGDTTFAFHFSRRNALSRS
jgi:hypothetical protein